MQYDAHAEVPIPAQKEFIIRDLESYTKLKINYNPDNYLTCEAAAKAFYEALKPAVIAEGQNPDSELFIRSPEETETAGYGRYWQVSWEAGPYEWAVVASLSGLYSRKNGWYTEPYYGFDVCFTEA